MFSSLGARCSGLSFYFLPWLFFFFFFPPSLFVLATLLSLFPLFDHVIEIPTSARCCFPFSFFNILRCLSCTSNRVLPPLRESPMILESCDWTQPQPLAKIPVLNDPWKILANDNDRLSKIPNLWCTVFLFMQGDDRNRAHSVQNSKKIMHTYLQRLHLNNRFGYVEFDFLWATSWLYHMKIKLVKGSRH